MATNMAGRGTDIPLTKETSELGGLHVIAACFNEAKRIDRQLYGRCARQGDPGSYKVMVSLEDELVQQNCHAMVVRFLRYLNLKKGMVQRKLILYFIRRAQRKIEQRHRETRQALIKHDRHTGRLLAFSGHME